MFSLGVLLSVLFVSASCGRNPLIDDIVIPHEVLDIDTKYRLPEYAVPENYDITLTPVLQPDNFTFSGKSIIDIKIVSKTFSLVFNARNLTIDEKKSTLADSKDKVNVREWRYDVETETVEMIFEKSLEVKNYKLTLEFTGTLLHDDYHGFYLSTYLDDKNKEQYVATTHFEPASARRAFPCWDEPEYKATFKITLSYPKKYNALSNMPKAEETSGAEKTTIIFKTTPKMSTYLVAFVISEYKSAPSNSSNHGVWTRKEAVESGKYALNVGQKVLTELDKYTGIKYLTYMDKMDQITIRNFSAGAMENWGLVTYREKSLLYTEGVTDISTKQSIVTIIAHEFAHQWFGNLVSPKWWKYIWLNEGFATYFQYYIADKLEPKWRLMDYFVVQALQASAFVVDARLNTRPMNQDVASPKDIRGLFDTIAYQKAGAVIRMMSQILTEEDFQKGLKQYLKDKTLGVAISDDLFDSIQKVIPDKVFIPEKKISLKEIMNEWVNRPGYPVVEVQKISSTHYILKQKRFTFDKTDDNTKWNIPITFTTEKELNFKNLTSIFIKDSYTLDTESDAGSDGWIIVNLQQTGYYRVNYEDENWNLLAKYLLSDKFSKIHVLNRAQLIDDSINLARAGQLGYNISLDILSYLHQEDDFIPWTPAFRAISFLNDKLATSEIYNTFKLFLKYTMKTAADTVKFSSVKDEDDTKKILRTSLLKWACKAEVPECTEEVGKQFKLWLDKSAKLDVDLKKNILCAGLRTADQSTWDKALEKYTKTTDVDEKTDILTALGCSDSEAILKKYLTSALDKDSKIGNFADVFEAVVANQPTGAKVCFETLLEEYDEIKTKVNDNGVIVSLLSKLGPTITSADQYSKISLFLAKHGLTVKAADAMQTAADNILWLESYGEPVEKWLNDNKGRFSSAGTTMATVMLVFVATLLTRFY